MQKGVNKVILLGNVGTEPEESRLPSGDAVCTISIATSESWKDKVSGETKEKTEWHRVVFFKNLAEIVGKFVKKGDKLYLEGRLQTRSWEKDGVKRYSTEIVSNEMQMLGNKEGRGQAGGHAVTSQSSADNKTSEGVDNFDDDIPF
jgi:single-strand DNA-binding protein